MLRVVELGGLGMSANVFLAPVLSLIVWTLLIWLLMYARRIPAMQKAKIDPESGKSPDGAWKSELPSQIQRRAAQISRLKVLDDEKF